MSERRENTKIYCGACGKPINSLDDTGFVQITWKNKEGKKFGLKVAFCNDCSETINATLMNFTRRKNIIEVSEIRR